LAPLALGVVFLALVLIVLTSTGGDSEQPVSSATEPRGRTETSGRTRTGTETSARTTTTRTTGTTSTTSTTPRTGEKTYTVESGDTLGTIAEETGLTVSELQELNPDVDSQALTVGEEIKLVP
jgi:LysM repeat protein